MITVERLNLTQGAFHLQDLSFHIPAKAYAVLMGRTGCGKTTTLEAIAGLRSIQSGRIRLNDIDVTDAPPWRRNIGYVPQDLALFQTMTVRQHLAFALHLRRRPQAQIDRRVAELAKWLQITGLLERLPKGLSGGEAQRVALGRALSFEPAVLLLDEPISSLDDATREPLVELLKSLPIDQHVSVLHVTHSQPEAQRLATMILRMESGRIVAG